MLLLSFFAMAILRVSNDNNLSIFYNDAFSCTIFLGFHLLQRVS